MSVSQIYKNQKAQSQVPQNGEQDEQEAFERKMEAYQAKIRQQREQQRIKEQAEKYAQIEPLLPSIGVLGARAAGNIDKIFAEDKDGELRKKFDELGDGIHPEILGEFAYMGADDARPLMSEFLRDEKARSFSGTRDDVSKMFDGYRQAMQAQQEANPVKPQQPQQPQTQAATQQQPQVQPEPVKKAPELEENNNVSSDGNSIRDRIY